MRILLVSYFDGVSSKPYNAQLVIRDSYWLISYKDESGLITKEVRWRVSEIKSSKVYTKTIKSFSYGEYPFQHLECESAAITSEINKYTAQKHLTNKYDNFLHQSSYKSLVSIIAVIVAISCVMYFYVLPTVAVSFVNTLDEKYVVGFGDYVFDPIIDGLDVDDERSKKLQEFFDALYVESNYPYKLYVVNYDMLNAFAVSGGKIVVFSGLLDKLENSNQLAALLGHEKTHIENRHVLKNVARDLSGYLFLSILFGDVNGVTAVLLENAHRFKSMSYSRDLEREADEGGYEMLIKNKINPDGLIDLFNVLKKETDSVSQETFKYISSHPMLEERINYVQSRLDNEGVTYEEDVRLDVIFRELKTYKNDNDNQDNEEHHNNGNK